MKYGFMEYEIYSTTVRDIPIITIRGYVGNEKLLRAIDPSQLPYADDIWENMVQEHQWELEAKKRIWTDADMIEFGKQIVGWNDEEMENELKLFCQSKNKQPQQ